MESHNPIRGGDPQLAEDEAARVAKRVALERELARLAKLPVEDSMFGSTVVFIVAAVTASIIAVLYVALR
jgi:hypothetical protein